MVENGDDEDAIINEDTEVPKNEPAKKIRAIKTGKSLLGMFIAEKKPILMAATHKQRYGDWVDGPGQSL